MKRSVLVLILFGGGVIVSGLAFLFYLRAVGPNWPVFGKADNVDGAFITGTHLRWMSTDIVTYFEACNVAEWEETCRLTNSTDIWAAMRKRIELHDKEQSLIDSWGDPYYFKVKRRPDATLIRIGSKGNGPPLNGTHMFVDLEFDPARKVIKKTSSWDPTIETGSSRFCVG